jgi:hypothetical protein
MPSTHRPATLSTGNPLMPILVEVWDRQARIAIPMFTEGARDAVAHNPDRFTLELPADAEPPTRPREPDAMARLFAGPTTQDRADEYRRSHRKPSRRRPPNRRRG